MPSSTISGEKIFSGLYALSLQKDKPALKSDLEEDNIQAEHRPKENQCSYHSNTDDDMFIHSIHLNEMNVQMN